MKLPDKVRNVTKIKRKTIKKIKNWAFNRFWIYKFKINKINKKTIKKEKFKKK